MSKKIIKIINIYWGEKAQAKYNNEYDFDTVEGRLSFVEDYVFGDIFEMLDDLDEPLSQFIHGEVSVLDVDDDSRDWDDPTGYHFEILTIDEAKKQLDDERIKQINQLDELL